MNNYILYLALLFKYGHKMAKHMVYHKRFEVWEMSEFGLSDKEDGWNSSHKITCTMCDHTRTANRFWLMASKWWGVGSKTEQEARKKAIFLSPHSK